MDELTRTRLALRVAQSDGKALAQQVEELRALLLRGLAPMEDVVPPVRYACTTVGWQEEAKAYLGLPNADLRTAGAHHYYASDDLDFESGNRG